eukprot:1002716_1
MGRTYYDCPCCERRVWVHSFWGAAWDGAICHACRDDHGDYTTSNCSVDGPAKRRRERKLADEAYEKAKREAEQYQLEVKRKLKEREEEERKRMDRLMREREKARQDEADRLKKEREKKKIERDEMKRKLAEEVADKKKAAEEIRQKIKKLGNPYRDFKKLETKKFIQDIGDRVIKLCAAGEVLGEKIPALKASLKKTLDQEFDIVKDEFVEYSKYVNGIKDLSGKFINRFDSILNKTEQNMNDATGNVEDLEDSDCDEEEKECYQKDMAKNIETFCDNVDNMLGEVAVIESYYDYMLKDCEYFNTFVKQYGDQYEDEQKDMHPAMSALLQSAKALIKDERPFDDPELVKTKFSATYESKTYIRDCNSVMGSMWNSTKDGVRLSGAVAVDIVTLGQAGLIGKCMKKIEDEKRKVTNNVVVYEMDEKFYDDIKKEKNDGKKHRTVLERFTKEALEKVKAPLQKVVDKYKSVYGESNAKTQEIKDFKENNIMVLKNKLQSFKNGVDELKEKLKSKTPLKQ